MKKHKYTHTIVSPRFTSFFAFPVIGISLIVLIGWFSGLMFLTRFSINEVPMAPSTAYIFIWLALGLWFYLRPQKIALNRNAAIASAIIVISLSGLIVITNSINYYGNWEHAFITIPETQLNMQLGHMSLVTAFLFLITGFALLFLQSNRKIGKTFSIILTLIIFIFSFILLLAYGFGAPFFYFDNFIPPAVLTVLSFLLISLALIASSDKNTFFIKTIMRANTSARLLRIFLPTTIAITVIESLIVIRILPLLNIHPAIGVSLVSLIVVAVVIIVISVISKSMGKSLDTALNNLSESEVKFRNVFENSPIGKSMIEIDGTLYVNQSFCEIIGYTQEELRTKSWMDISHPDEIQQTTELTQSLLKGSISQAQFEKRYIHKNGAIVFTDVSTYLQRDTNGDPQFFITSVSDITERKQVEEKLNKSNKFSKEIIEAMSDGFSILDESGVHIDVNLAFCKMTGFAKDELIGIGPPHPYWPEEEYENIQEAFVKTGQGNFESFELIFKNKNGKRFPVLVNPSQIKDDQGNIVSNFASVIDITEREKAELALKQSEEQLRTITNNLPVLISQIDKDFKYLFVNQYYYDRSPFESGIIGKDVIDVMGEETFNRALPNMKKALSGESVSFENRTTHTKNNELIIFETNYIPHIIDGKIESFFVLGMVITERKLAEEKLKESEEKFKKIFKLSPVLMTLTDIETGVYLDVNDTFLSEFGFTRDEVIGTKSTDLDLFLNPSAREDIIRFFKDQGFISNHEFQLRRKSGKIIHSIFSSHIIELENKRVMLTTAIDISDCKLAEKALRESEEKFRKLFHSTALPLCYVDSNGTITIINKRFIETFGYTHDEIPTLKVWWQKAYPDEKYRKWVIQNWEMAIAKAVKTGKDIKSDEYNVTCKDGSIRNIIISGNTIEENFLATFIDITDRKLTEKALRESEEKLNALFTSLTEMVVINELVLNAAGEPIDYRIIDCNKVFTEFTGIRKEDAIDKLASEVYQTDTPPYLDQFAKVAVGGDSLEFTSYDASLDKHLLISVVSPQTGNFATITTDISAMMQIQEIIMAKNKEMENYLYIASHDLRTPLVNIQGFSQRLKKQADSIKSLFADKTLEPEILHQLGIITDEDIPKTLGFVLSSIEKMDALINGLLQLSRTGRVDMNIQKIDMNELLAKTLQSLDFQIKEAHCKIHNHPLSECYGDAALLDQLFANIISNALKYADSERALEITVEAKKINNSVIYTISDTGKGMAQKYLDKIWDVFYRIDPRSGKTGEGIGLSLVKRIADKHKGKVWVESEENKGSKFFIELNNRRFIEI